jgi:predicted XRE-type DNA-binding protein
MTKYFKLYKQIILMKNNKTFQKKKMMKTIKDLIQIQSLKQYQIEDQLKIEAKFKPLNNSTLKRNNNMIFN